MGKGLSSILAHSGDGQPEKQLRRQSSVPEVFPIYLSSVFAFDDVKSVDDIYDGLADGYIYARIGNPNGDVTASVIAEAENAEKATVFSSGLAAITTSILAVVSAGDHIVSSPVLYGGVRDFLEHELARFGVEVTFTDFSDPANIENAVKKETKLIYTETISNPLMDVADIPEIAAIAKKHGVYFFIDNTFATPVITKPVEYGADLVLYSATKYLGGHNDVVAGAAAGRADLIDLIRKKQVLYGPMLGPVESWLLARSLKTLELRVTKQSHNALEIARFLENHPNVDRVYYPGLASSQGHDAAKRLFRNGLYGGMLSFDVKGGEAGATAVINHLETIKYVPSLAGVATTVSYSAKTSHRFVAKEELDRLGIGFGQLRLSVGIEEAHDIIDELERALGEIPV